MHEVLSGFQEYMTAAPLMAFPLAFLAGVLTSLTPCVYPMIPVTAAFIGGASTGSSPKRGLVLSVAYVLGIAITYCALGAAAALTGTIFGNWVSHPLVYFIIANIFILLGLSMLDVFMLPVPGFMTSASPRNRRQGIVGAFTVGAASSLVAAPCTAPVLLSILTFVATRQNVVYGISLLFAFALGMGLLLVIVGTFAGAVASMPKSGAWMDKVKKGFGLLLIIAGEYFLVQCGRMWL